MSNKNESIHLKLAKARNLPSEVDVLIRYRFYATAINRLYYACFHATKALLLSEDFTPKTHSGVIAVLHQHFVQAGSFNFEKASFFSRLMQERIDDDYSDFLVIAEDEVLVYVEPARAYVAYIEGLLSGII